MSDYKPMKVRHIRVGDDLWEKCLQLGGSRWIRAKLSTAIVVDHRKKTTTLTKIEAKDLK